MFDRLSDGWKIVLQLAFVAALLALVTVLLLSLGIMGPTKGNRRIQFRVEASGGVAIITLQAGKTSISKPTTVTAPWTKTLDVPNGTEVYLTAANPTQTGKLSCSITLDKIPWKSETTNAPKDGVACAGIVP
jgi:hypothetical protein